jgi:hypothetical protein
MGAVVAGAISGALQESPMPPLRAVEKPPKGKFARVPSSFGTVTIGIIPRGVPQLDRSIKIALTDVDRTLGRSQKQKHSGSGLVRRRSRSVRRRRGRASETHLRALHARPITHFLDRNRKAYLLFGGLQYVRSVLEPSGKISVTQSSKHGAEGSVGSASATISANI